MVVGLRHPLPHFKGKAIKELRKANIRVDVFGENMQMNATTEVDFVILYYAQFPLIFENLTLVAIHNYASTMLSNGQHTCLSMFDVSIK